MILVARLLTGSLLRGRRALMLGALCLVAGSVNLVAQAISGSYHRQQAWGLIGEQLIVTQVLAFVALLLAASALGDLREDGTILYLASTPRRRLELVLGAWLAATVATLVVLAPALVFQVVEGVIIGVPSAALVAIVGAAVLTAAGYSALFVMLSLVVRRAVIAGLAYLAFWELSIANIARSGSYASISAHGRNLVDRALDVHPPGALGHAPMAPAGSVIVVICLIGVFLALGAWRLGRVELP